MSDITPKRFFIDHTDYCISMVHKVNADTTGKGTFGIVIDAFDKDDDDHTQESLELSLF